MSEERKKCNNCTELATKTLLGQGGKGICISYLCGDCFILAKKTASELIRITGLEDYSIPPGLRD